MSCDGTPESFAAAEEIVFAERLGQDFGYTTTAQNADGSLVTVYYANAKTDADQNAAIYAVRWNLPK